MEHALLRKLFFMTTFHKINLWISSCKIHPETPAHLQFDVKATQTEAGSPNPF